MSGRKETDMLFPASWEFQTASAWTSRYNTPACAYQEPEYCKISTENWTLIRLPAGGTLSKAMANQREQIGPRNAVDRSSTDSSKSDTCEDEALNFYKSFVEQSSKGSTDRQSFHMDGDYMILVEARKQKRSSEKALPNITEDEMLVSETDTSGGAGGDGISDVREKHREEIFQLISDNDTQGVHKFCEDKPEMWQHFTKQCYKDQNSLKTVLHHAIDCEAWDVVKFLLKCGGEAIVLEPFTTQTDGEASSKTALHQLAENGSVKFISKSLEFVANAKRKNSYINEFTLVKTTGQRPRQMNAMHIASLHGHAELVKMLLNLGVHVDVQNNKQDTPLLWAVRGGHLHIVKILLTKNADCNHENDKGSTPLYWAVRYGHNDILLTLIKQGRADVNQKRKLGLVAPIILASALGLSDIVNILADNGADVNTVIRNGETALQHAAAEGNVKAVKTLIVHGADVNAADDLGHTSLILAAKNQQAETVNVLASAGADLVHETHGGHTVWHYAVESLNNDIVIALIEHMKNTADFFIYGQANTVQFPKGKTPLHIAAQKGYFSKVKCLLEHGVDGDGVDEHDNTFLHVAAKFNNKEIIKTHGNKVNLNSKNSDGETVLHLACKHGHTAATMAALKLSKADEKNKRLEIPLHLAAKNPLSSPDTVRKLMDFMIKKHNWSILDTPDENGNTALHLAAKYSSADIISVLRYLNVKAVNSEGDTPLHIAIKRGDNDIFDVLLATFHGIGQDLDFSQQNSKGESFLHIAAEKRNIYQVTRLIEAGVDVDLRDALGNTVLHIITTAIAFNNNRTDEYLGVFVAIIENSVRWWCVNKQLPYPSDDEDRYNKYKREAVLKLLTSVRNGDELSVLELAASIGATEVIQHSFNIRNVFRFENAQFVKFDVTHCTPDTLKTRKNRNGKKTLTVNGGLALHAHRKVFPEVSEHLDYEKNENFEDPSESLLHMMVNQKQRAYEESALESMHRSASLLSITPINQMVRNYWRKHQWAYGLLGCVHILYMSVLCATVFQWLPKGTNSSIYEDNNTQATYIITPNTPQVWPNILILLWPMILLVYEIYSICVGIRNYFKNKRSQEKKEITPDSTLNFVISTVMLLFLRLYGTIFAMTVLTWFILYTLEDTKYQDYVVAIGLILGWIYTIQFTKGFKKIHHFSLMLKNMIIRDMTKFLLLYLFVLLAFTTAFHALFQASVPISTSFPTVFHSAYFVFNLMIGMTDFGENVPDENVIEIGKTTGFIKIIYILYMILSNIILLNLLIALMNDSYSNISAEQEINWRVGSIRLALEIEKELPMLTYVLQCFKQRNSLQFDHVTNRWYLTLPLNSTSPNSVENELDVTEKLSNIEDHLVKMDKKYDALDARLGAILNKLEKIGDTSIKQET